MNIPDKAVEAAARAMSGQIWWDHTPESDKDEVMEDAREALEAAAPYIQAEVLHHASTEMRDEEDAAWLKSWADELDPHE